MSVLLLSSVLMWSFSIFQVNFQLVVSNHQSYKMASKGLWRISRCDGLFQVTHISDA